MRTPPPLPRRSPPPLPLGLRIRGALAAIDGALVAIATMGKALLLFKGTLESTARQLRDLDAELTPVRPPSRDDMRAALQGAQNFGTGSNHPPKP